MFLGTYFHNIDAKGRLFIPAKLRSDRPAGESGYVLTQGLEGCLYLFEPRTFDAAVMSKMDASAVSNKQDIRAFKRFMLAGAQDVALDDMGRILVSKNLIHYAAIKKDVAILGVGERIELWSAEKWKLYSRKAMGAFQKLGRQLEI